MSATRRAQFVSRIVSWLFRRYNSYEAFLRERYEAAWRNERELRIALEQKLKEKEKQ